MYVDMYCIYCVELSSSSGQERLRVKPILLVATKISKIKIYTTVLTYISSFPND